MVVVQTLMSTGKYRVCWLGTRMKILPKVANKAEGDNTIANQTVDCPHAKPLWMALHKQALHVKTPLYASNKNMEDI